MPQYNDKCRRGGNGRGRYSHVWARGHHKYAHASVSAASLLLNCHLDAYHPQQSIMGNAHSQDPSHHRIQKLPRKIADKLPALPLGRAKDSGYRSGSASSSGTAVKGARANDQTNTIVVSTAGSDQGSAARPEAAPAAAEKRSDAPAPVTETVCRNHAIYGSANRLLISLPPPYIFSQPPKARFQMAASSATVPCQVISFFDGGKL